MGRRFALVYMFVLAMTGSIIGCGVEQPEKAQEVTFGQLFSDPDQYNGKNIAIEGFYFDGFEVQVIAEKLEVNRITLDKY